LKRSTQQLGREVKPTIYSRKQWTQRGARGDSFVKRVLAAAAHLADRRRRCPRPNLERLCKTGLLHAEPAGLYLYA
jgi:hypothetical protein